MKNYIITIVVSFLIGVSGLAQDKNFGLIGGLNYANVFGDLKDNFNTERRLSFHLGVYSEFELSKNFSLSPRIIYSSQGYNLDLELRQTIDSPITIFEIANRLNYLNIPILFKYYVDSRISLNFGPQLGFLLNTASVNKNPTSFSIDSQSLNSSGDFKIDYGAKIGLTYLVNNNINIEIGYFQGFSNISRGEIASVVNNESNNNSVFQLSVGYSLF